MSVSADLSRHAIPGQLEFRVHDSGLVFAMIDNPQARAEICLQGGHLTTWSPKDQAEPVIWLSDRATFAPGKSIRGGVPVCWPWFGPHEREAGYPGHGFARTVPWEVVASAALPGGETELRLHLVDNETSRMQWPHPCELELVARVGATLTIELVTRNRGEAAFRVGEALHTYFHIGDIADIRIHGLDGASYVDKVDGGARKRQAGEITCAGEVDRVYLDTAADCVIEDARLARRIRIAKQGSQSTVVWTPWRDKAEKMGDFGPGRADQGGWREMVCVESGNALDNVVEVPAGAEHTLRVQYSVEKQ